MPSTLSTAQLQQLADEWTNFASALSNYQAIGKDDPGYDDQAMDDWIQDAAAWGANFSVSAMTATFNDAAAAFSQLQATLKQANTYISSLAQDAQRWTRAAAVISAMLSLASVASGGSATTILGAAVSVVKAAS